MTLAPPALQRPPSEQYGWARFPETTKRVPYGRFRNVYLYITEECQLRCSHCYMGERLERAIRMPKEEVFSQLRYWRKMGGDKLTILGGEATMHPDFEEIIAFANHLGYSKVILTTNGLKSSLRKLRRMSPDLFAYVQVSLDGGSAASHDQIRGRGTFKIAAESVKELCALGFDTRIICTVNKTNIDDCLDLLPFADEVGVSLTKFHVFSGIGTGRENEEMLVAPSEWIEFYETKLAPQEGKWKTQIWYQPTYARRSEMKRFEDQGYLGCIGRTLDRISVFPDGRAYVCSYLFDTDLNYGQMRDGYMEVNRGPNEFDLFSRSMSHSACGGCKVGSCAGGCPAEELVMGGASCREDDIVPVCRLWKADS